MKRYSSVSDFLLSKGKQLYCWFILYPKLALFAAAVLCFDGWHGCWTLLGAISYGKNWWQLIGYHHLTNNVRNADECSYHYQMNRRRPIVEETHTFPTSLSPTTLCLSLSLFLSPLSLPLAVPTLSLSPFISLPSLPLSPSHCPHSLLKVWKQFP